MREEVGSALADTGGLEMLCQLGVLLNERVAPMVARRPSSIRPPTRNSVQIATGF